MNTNIPHQEEKTRDNSLWIEITDRKGFLMFGDLSRHQREEGIKISSNQVDIICSNCHHKYTFEKNAVGAPGKGERRLWDWWEWRVFLKGNQLSKGRRDYFVELSVEFYCRHCQGFLPTKFN